MWTIGQATSVLTSGLEKVGEKWGSQEKGAVAEQKPGEFALHLGRIEGATRLAEMGARRW